MHKGLLIFFLFSTTLINAQDINVLHYRFSLDLNDSNDTLSGLAEIKFLHQTRATNITFDLRGTNREGKGMKVFSASLGSVKASPLPVKQEAEKFTVTLPSAKNGDTATIFISYKGIPDDGLIISKNKFGERTFFADNWPNRAHYWIPCIDRPDDKASSEFLVSAPSRYSVVSNGVKVQEKDMGNGKRHTHWKEDIPLPTKVMVIGVARFAVKTFEDSPANLPVSAWVYPQDSTKGFHDFALATGIVRFFSDYIAPFPYKKLANVQSTTIFGGMENASAIFYTEDSVTGNRSSEGLLAHEIAHQWFGDAASEKSFPHLWLSEGFATYFTDLYFEKKYGREAAVNRLKKERNEVVAFAWSSDQAVVDSTSDLMSLLNANSYQKGAWILHMLRNEVGDDLFQKIIQTYYNRFKGGNATSNDFASTATEVAGRDLQPFFNQWLHSPGVPRVKMNWVWEKNRAVLTIRQMQAKPFAFPLEIKIIQGNNIEKTIKMDIRKKVEIISFSLPDKPVKITLDPETRLLFAE